MIANKPSAIKLLTAIGIAVGLTQAATLTGKVTDANNSPLRNASVILKSSGASANTDSLGNYSIDLSSTSIANPNLTQSSLSINGQNLVLNLNSTQNVQIQIFDIAGHSFTLTNQVLNVGSHNFSLTQASTNFANNGVYFCKLSTDEGSNTYRLLKMQNTAMLASKPIASNALSAAIDTINASLSGYQSAVAPVFSYTTPMANIILQKEVSGLVVGYYPGWVSYDYPNFTPAAINYSKWTHINYAFLQAALDGSISGTDPDTLNGDPPQLFGTVSTTTPSDTTKYYHYTFSTITNTNIQDTALNKIKAKSATGWYLKGTGLLDLAHAKGVPVIASIGGWTLSSNFPTVAGSATTRAKFASSCANLIRNYGFDGIDIDWEYPGYTDHHGTASDAVNYITMLNLIKDSLAAFGKTTGKHYSLTTALPCGPDKIVNINIPALDTILDHFNLMTYDLHGPWDSTADYHTGLYASAIGDTNLSVSGCVKNYLRGGATANKINLGVAFYGYADGGAQKIGDVITGDSSADVIALANAAGSDLDYKVIEPLIQSGILTRYWDATAMTPYATWKGGFVTYEDTASIAAKIQYAKQEGLAGAIVWDMSGDNIGTTTPLLDALQGIR